VLLNGHTLLADVQTTGAWQEFGVAISGGVGKLSDVVLEVRADTAALPNDERDVGVLLDQATYRVTRGPSGFVAPYPSQVVLGGLVLALTWLLAADRLRTTGHARRALPAMAGVALLVGGAFVLLYRMQPPLYPYPLRWLLPGLVALLAALLALRHMPALLVHHAALPDILAVGGVGVWLGTVLLAARTHVTLSVPGVEKDFRVFATRTASLDDVFRADGFYNLGYPLLLWLVQPLTHDNAFLAGRLVAAFSGALLLLAGYWLARMLLADLGAYRRMGALVALVVLALSPLVVRYALYVGSDMPFAALSVLALALLLAGVLRARQGEGGGLPAWGLLLLAGLTGGLAFLVRHMGLALLVWGVLVLLLAQWQAGGSGRWTLADGRRALLFGGGFVLAALPQVVVNMAETGQPLYNLQAKNVWLAVYTGVDWGRWGEVPDTIRLGEVVARDPARFLGNWWGNLIGFVGSGAEDMHEFGRAVQLRLLAWPANWLAVAGLAGWLLLAAWRRRGSLRPPADAPWLAVWLRPGMLVFAALYVLGVSMAFVLPRFFLPLVPLYAAAAAWSLGALTLRGALLPAGTALTAAGMRRQVAVLLVLLALLAGGFHTGVAAVLAQQPADEVAAIQLTLEALQPGEQVLTRLPADVPIAKYSALAHRALPWAELAHGQDERDVLAQARAAGATYLLWDSTYGTPALPAPRDMHVGQAGMYELYRLERLSP
jgi:hypothetical protein